MRIAANRVQLALVIATLGMLVAFAVLRPAGAAPQPTDDEEQVQLTLARRDDLKPRSVTPKPARTEAKAGYSTRIVHVKFRQGALVRLRNGGLTTIGTDDLDGLDAFAARHPGMEFARLIEQSELGFARDRARLEAKTKEEMPDLNLWYKIHLPAGVTAAEAANELNGLSIVELAYPEHLAEPPPGPVEGPPSPDYTSEQGYKRLAGEGIDAFAAYTLSGGSGYLAKIFDIEYGWNINHEDLSRARAVGAVIPNGTATNPFTNDHGTAVIGELIADNNAFGVTGISPGSALRLINQRNTGGDARVNAINLARTNADPGDVVLLEMQTGGPNGTCSGGNQVGCVPVEWIAAIYDAIKLTTAGDIYVVEAAGNGSQNLDAPEYATWRNKTWSGAFIVGAGGSSCYSSLREKLSFSNYGSMIHLQGWGQCVMTTGYGDTHGSSESNNAYTRSFSGTSSASPIVAGAVALYSSIQQYQDGNGNVWFPGALQFVLAFSASPQVNPATGQIGGLPNLRRALRSYDNLPPFQPGLGLFDQSTGLTTHSDGTISWAIGGSDNLEIEAYYFSEDPATPPANAAGWTSALSGSHTLTGVDGLKTFYGWTKDYNDNISPRAEASIALDTGKPTATFTAPATANKRKIPLVVTGADDASGVAAYYLQPQDPTPPLETSLLWTATPPDTYTFTGKSGSKTLYLWVKDNAGNISDAVTASIVFDNKRPIVTIDDPATGSLNPSVAAVSGTVTDNVPPNYTSADITIGKRLGGGQCAFWNIRQRALENHPCNTPKRFLVRAGPGNVPDWTRNIRNLNIPGRYFVIVRFVDYTGNIGTARTSFRVVVAPGTPPSLR